MTTNEGILRIHALSVALRQAQDSVGSWGGHIRFRFPPAEDSACVPSIGRSGSHPEPGKPSGSSGKPAGKIPVRCQINSVAPTGQSRRNRQINPVQAPGLIGDWPSRGTPVPLIPTTVEMPMPPISTAGETSIPPTEKSPLPYGARLVRSFDLRSNGRRDACPTGKSHLSP